MLTNYIPDDRTRENLLRHRCGAELDGFAVWLSSFRYSAQTIRSYMFAAARYDAWACERQYDLPSIMSPDRLRAYRAHLKQHLGRHGRDSSNSFCGARRFAKYLGDRSGVQIEASCDTASLEMRFLAWLRDHRGVGSRTAEGNALKVRRLLSALGSDPQLYTAVQLRDFVLAQSRGYSNSHVDTVVTSVRMFMRFLIIHKECSESLQYAIPRVAKWQKSSLPRYLSPTDVQHIIDTCDPSNPLGARDRAILVLLAAGLEGR